MEAILTDLKLGHFRCFERFEARFCSGLNLIVGPNAAGKTSLLEAACVLLRLQSPRTTRLGDLIQHGARGLLVDGHARHRHLQFYYSPARKKLALDSVEQKSASDYLRTGRVVWFSNTDIELIRGASDVRRRFLDFVASQSVPGYRPALLDYARALRARNLLLKQPVPRWKEIAAFDAPLVQAGDLLQQARQLLCTSLRPLLQLAHTGISGGAERIDAVYSRGCGENFATALEASRGDDARLRQTNVGPHRDDWELILQGHPASLGSEGQQRTFALALRLAAARYLEAHFGEAPLLLLDDIFGELDLKRRAALMAELPRQAQQIATTTQLEWLPNHAAANVLRLGESNAPKTD
jgi:DNA replication and repair protein RecF